MANLDNLIIRDAVQDDCAAITNLHNLAIQEGLLSWSCPRAGTETLDMLQSLDALNYPRTVAVNDQEVIGFAALRPVWDPREDAGCMYSANLHLVVSKQYRKEGLASRLLEHLQTHERTASRQLHRLACKLQFTPRDCIPTCVLQAKYCPSTHQLIHGLFPSDFTIAEGQSQQSHQFALVDSLGPSLKGIAEKNGIACDLEHFSKFIGPAPAVAGRGFPNLSVADPYPPKRFTLPIQPATVQIRDATMDDLPSSKSAASLDSDCVLKKLYSRWYTEQCYSVYRCEASCRPFRAIGMLTSICRQLIILFRLKCGNEKIGWLVFSLPTYR